MQNDHRPEQRVTSFISGRRSPGLPAWVVGRGPTSLNAVWRIMRHCRRPRTRKPVPPPPGGTLFAGLAPIDSPIDIRFTARWMLRSAFGRALRAAPSPAGAATVPLVCVLHGNHPDYHACPPGPVDNSPARVPEPEPNCRLASGGNADWRPLGKTTGVLFGVGHPCPGVARQPSLARRYGPAEFDPPANLPFPPLLTPATPRRCNARITRSAPLLHPGQRPPPRGSALPARHHRGGSSASSASPLSGSTPPATRLKPSASAISMRPDPGVLSRREGTALASIVVPPVRS